MKHLEKMLYRDCVVRKVTELESIKAVLLKHWDELK